MRGKKIVTLPLVVLCSVLCVSCGFRPLLAPQQERSNTASKHGHSLTLKISGIEGYVRHAFDQYLKKRLSPFHFPEKRTLEVTLSQTYQDVSFGQDATTIRSQNILIADYVLRKEATVLKKGRVDSVTSFHLDANDEFSTLNSRAGSDEKVIQALGEEVLREILVG